MEQPQIEISERDLYWLAGLLEGEGSFCVPRKGAYYFPRLYLASTDKDIVDRVASLLGEGATVWSKEGQKLTHNRVYYVCIQSRRSLAWMRKLQPLMGERRQQQIQRAINASSEYRDNPCKMCGGKIKREKGRYVYCSTDCGVKFANTKVAA